MFKTAWILVLLLLCSVLRSVKKGKINLVDYTKNKRGEENVLEEICLKCSKKFKCYIAGIYEDESRMMQYYAHFYIYLQIGIYFEIWACYAITMFSISERH